MREELGEGWGSPYLVRTSVCIWHMKTGERNQRNKRPPSCLGSFPETTTDRTRRQSFPGVAKPGTEREGLNLNPEPAPCPLPTPLTNVMLLTSSFYLPHCNNIFNYWLNCRCPMSHLNKSHMYETVNCVLRAIPSCKNRGTQNIFFSAAN